MSQRIILKLVFAIFSVLPSVWGLNDEFVRDMHCIPPPKADAVGMDLKWVTLLNSLILNCINNLFT